MFSNIKKEAVTFAVAFVLGDKEGRGQIAIVVSERIFDAFITFLN